MAYLAFPGEQHGFRRAETIVAVAEAELGFFGDVLGFAPADALPHLLHDGQIRSEEISDRYRGVWSDLSTRPGDARTGTNQC